MAFSHRFCSPAEKVSRYKKELDVERGRYGAHFVRYQLPIIVILILVILVD